MKQARAWMLTAVALAAACSSKDEDSDGGGGIMRPDSGDQVGTGENDGGDDKDGATAADAASKDAGAGSDAGEVYIDDAGKQGDAGGGSDCTGLKATIRDFKIAHDDFEGNGTNSVHKDIVKTELGADHKPVYALPGAGADTSGPANFAQWYNDVPGVNQAFAIDIPLVQTQPGLFVYDNTAFFPIDGKGFGNEGNPHNFHFTTEIHTRFTYKSGEVFTFRGDDDLWAFVNNKLVIDLGGIHVPQSQTIDFDAKAAELGLTKGETYEMDIFHAERHTVESNFRIETSIACFKDVDIN